MNDRVRMNPPELAAIMTMSVSPDARGRVEVSGLVHTMAQTLVDRKSYRFDSWRINRTVAIGESWELLLGQTGWGQEFVVSLKVERYGSEAKGTWPSNDPSFLPIRIKYKLNDLRNRGRERSSTQSAVLEVGPRNFEHTHVRLESPVSARGADSTIIFMKISFEDVRFRENNRGQTVMEGVFVMIRDLAMGVLPSDDPHVTSIHGITIKSKFRRPVTLNPGRKIRIEIPPQEGEEKYIRTVEHIVLEVPD